MPQADGIHLSADIGPPTFRPSSGSASIRQLRGPRIHPDRKGSQGADSLESAPWLALLNPAEGDLPHCHTHLPCNADAAVCDALRFSIPRLASRCKPVKFLRWP